MSNLYMTAVNLDLDFVLIINTLSFDLVITVRTVSQTVDISKIIAVTLVLILTPRQIPPTPPTSTISTPTTTFTPTPTTTSTTDSICQGNK